MKHTFSSQSNDPYGADVSGSGMKLDPSMRLVPTNMPGIFEKVRDRPDTGANSLSIAPLIHSGLLARLQEADTPAARTFRERILGGRWRPEDQISPSLQPRIGITHQLTDRVQTQNTDFTTKNWAGGTIKGAWKAAVGIWRIPFVSMPRVRLAAGIRRHGSVLMAHMARTTCCRPAYSNRYRAAAMRHIPLGSSGTSNRRQTSQPERPLTPKTILWPGLGKTEFFGTSTR